MWGAVAGLFSSKPELLHTFEDDGRHGVYGYTCRSLFYTLVREIHEAPVTEAADGSRDEKLTRRLSGNTRASSPSREERQQTERDQSFDKSSNKVRKTHKWSCHGKKILVSPLMHRNGFLAVMQNACKDDPSRLVSLDLDANADCTGTWRLVVPDGEGGESPMPDPSEVGMIVVTHLFGVRYGMDWCEPYR